jgi:hypothetical protein
MMRNFAIIFIAAVLGMVAMGQQPAQPSPPAQAATQALPPDAATREQVSRFFDLLQIAKLYATSLQASQEQVQALSRQIIREFIPDPTPEEEQRAEQLTRDVYSDAMKVVSVDGIVQAIIPIYQRHFTRGEMDALIAFYSSPLGQKFVQAQPEMVRESVEVLAPLQQKMMQQILDKMKQRMEKMAEEEKQGAKPK